MTVNILKEFKKKQHAPDSLMKSGYVDNAYMLYDDARELNFTFGYDNHVLSEGYFSIEDRKKAYFDVTPNDILRASREIFCLENLTVTIKGNKKKTDVERIKNIIASL